VRCYWNPEEEQLYHKPLFSLPSLLSPSLHPPSPLSFSLPLCIIIRYSRHGMKIIVPSSVASSFGFLVFDGEIWYYFSLPSYFIIYFNFNFFFLFLFLFFVFCFLYFFCFFVFLFLLLFKVWEGALCRIQFAGAIRRREN
jgi:hypothetical protein